MSRDQIAMAAVEAHEQFIELGGLDAVRADDATAVRRAFEAVLTHLADTGQITAG